MEAKAGSALMFIIFSLNILHITSNSVQGHDGNKGTMITGSRKLEVEEIVQSTKMAAHGGGGAHFGGGGAHVVGGGAHVSGGGGAHGEAGAAHGEGNNGESSSTTTTPGTANVIPAYGAAAARRHDPQSHHKGGGSSHTCTLGMVTSAILVPLFF